MRTLALLSLTALALAGAPAAAAERPAALLDAEQLLRRAFFTEVALSSPEEAGPLYRAAAERADAPARLRALAHLRSGICLQLLEDFAGAEREFRTVVERFASEEDAVHSARRRLGEAPRDPARFMPPEVVLYAELVEPGEQASFLADLIRGTPVENPVDYYLLTRPDPAAAPVGPSPGPRPDPQLNQLRAVLNLNVLKELEKIEGIGFGATRLAEPSEWLLVFLPGTSELSRAIIKAVLPAVMTEDPPEMVEGMRIFRLRRQPLHFAIDGREEVALLGATREIVAEAIRRAAARADPPPGSLAAVGDFRRAQAARAGSMLFAYADREKLVEALRDGTPSEGRPAFEEARKLLGLDHLRAVGATLARAGDDLRFTLRARVAPEHPLWPLLRTPPGAAAGLAFVPADALGVFTTRVVEGGARWARLREAFDPVVGGLPGDEHGGSELRSLLRVLDGGLGMDFGGDILGELTAISAAVPARLHDPPQLSFYIVAEFRDGDAAQPRVERLLAAAARRAFPAAAPVEFHDQPPLGTVRLRWAEPTPGFRVLYAREGAAFVISAIPAIVQEAVEARLAGGPGAGGLVPVPAAKALVLRPREIRRLAGPPAFRDGGDALIGHLPRAVFFTEESADGLAVELRIPRAAEAVREALKALPVRR